MYSKLCEAVWALQYNHVGPADKRCYQQAMLGGGKSNHVGPADKRCYQQAMLGHVGPADKR